MTASSSGRDRKTSGNVSAVVFDYGGVISTAQDPEIQRSMCEVLGLSKREFEALYYRYRPDYDRGRLSATDYWRSILGSTEVSAEEDLIPDLIRMDVRSWAGVNQGVLDWAWRLAEGGYRLGILSNMPQDELDFLRARYSWIGRFDVAMFSCEHGLIKPELEIFERLKAEIGLPADQILFLDDTRQHVEVARACGLQALRFQSLEDTARNWRWSVPGPN